MPRHKRVIPRDAFKMCTTASPNHYKVGVVTTHRKTNRQVEVVALDEVVEDGETVYDVYVVYTD